jgi:hypothetical protein
MFYVKKDDIGNIVAFNTHKTKECTEPLNFDQEPNLNSSLKSDLSMIRVLEDLVQTLVKKSIINITDLPKEAQKKLTDRKKLRETGSLKNNNHGLIKI